LGIRVYEFAKELGIPSKELLKQCQEQGIPVSNHMNSLDDEQEKRMREYLAGITFEEKPKDGRHKKVKPKSAPPPRLATAPPIRPVTAPPIHPGGGGPSKLPPVRPVTLPTKRRQRRPPSSAPRVAKVNEESTTTLPKAPVTEQKSDLKIPAGDKIAAEGSVAPEAKPTAKFGIVKAAPPKPEPKLEKPPETPPKPKVEPSRFGVVKAAPKKIPEKETPQKKPSTAAPTAKVEKDKFARLDEETKLKGKKAGREGRHHVEGRAVRIRRRDSRRPGRPSEGGQAFRRPRRPLRTKNKTAIVERKPIEEAVLDYPVSVRSFSAGAGVKADRIIRILMESKGLFATINQALPEDIVQFLASEVGVKIEVRKQATLEEEVLGDMESAKMEGRTIPRAPVVVFLGHVDHGKTSLLDAIRSTNVAAGESGGITQHTSAFRVDRGNKHVVFLDTPGHEAFTAMRARGADCTDVAVLVIAVDDGIMPQTDEAINHARAAGVPIVVALNKIDRPDADPDKVKRQLGERDLLPEDWGGSTICVPVSAITKEGIEDLLEMLSLEAELLELNAHPDMSAKGIVLEAKMAPGRGVVANVLIQNGTLHKGDIGLCGVGWGRIRQLVDDQGRNVKEAGPSTPVEVSGLSALPEAGDKFYSVEDAQKARSIAESRRRRERAALLAERQHVTLETLYEHIEQGGAKELRIILKSDVQGTLEVLRKQIEDLTTEEVRVRVLHSGAGGINESDVLLADASDAIIIGFHVMPEEGARRFAEERKVEIRLYQVVYQATNEIRAAIEGMLEPEYRENIVAHVDVLKTFKISKVGTAAGCIVKEGTIHRPDRVRVVRDSIVIHDGEIETLRRVKDDVREVSAGADCGIKIAKFDDIKEGDVFVAYQVEKIARRLSQVKAEEEQRRREKEEERERLEMELLEQQEEESGSSTE